MWCITGQKGFQVQRFTQSRKQKSTDLTQPCWDTKTATRSVIQLCCGLQFGVITVLSKGRGSKGFMEISFFHKKSSFLLEQSKTSYSIISKANMLWTERRNNMTADLKKKHNQHDGFIMFLSSWIVNFIENYKMIFLYDSVGTLSLTRSNHTHMMNIMKFECK